MCFNLELKRIGESSMIGGVFLFCVSSKLFFVLRVMVKDMMRFL